MSDTVIRVEDVSKQYRLGEVGTGTLSHDLNRAWARMRGKPDPFLKVTESNDRAHRGASQYVWALQDITFEVKQGEVLGIIGRNGAGKSTLLKILSRVTAPTTGQIKLKGRVASLLEVGTGFHPELTGRENVYLNGAIMGMSRAETAKKMDEIVDFSGCERYIDTPVKRYSSGMRVRLGFAVAAHLDPEILIVDEVLAVGDAEFQKKCVGKMQDVSGEGRTVLFVSHNMGSVSDLTTSAVLMERGGLSCFGKPNDIIKRYAAGSYSARTSSERNDLAQFRRPSKQAPPAKIIRIRTHAPIIPTGNPITFEFEVDVAEEVPSATLAFTLLDGLHRPITTILSLDAKQTFHFPKGKHCIRCQINDFTLAPGRYFVTVGLNRQVGTQAWDVIENYPVFEVTNEGEKMIHYRVDRKGVLFIHHCQWEHNRC